MMNPRPLGALGLLLLSIGSAFAQSSPGLIHGQVPTAGQWNSYFAAKQDTLNYTPINKAGDFMIGRLITAASTTLQAGLNLPQGIAPATPVNGDMWTTTAGVFVRVNGVTVGPLTGGSSAGFAGVSPIGVTFPAGVVTYAFDFTVANIFLAPQNLQMASGAGPGWFAQITGDTVPRVRSGMNSANVPGLSLGSGSGVLDTFIERVGAASIRHGAPDAASPVAQAISVQNVVAGTSNTAGVNLTISGSQGTGTGVGGSIVFQVASAGSTGSAQNALAAALTIDSTKKATFAAGIQATAAALGGATIGSNALAVTGTSLFNSGVTMGAALTYGGVTLSNSVSGTGSMVLATGAALVTPTLGVATGTSLALGGCTITSNTFCTTGSAAITGTLVQVGANAFALAVGPNGGTNPSFRVDSSTASAATGLFVKSAAAGGGLAVSVLTSGTNENLTLDAAGSGTIIIGGTSTGNITLSRATTINATTFSSTINYGAVTLAASVTGTGSMVLSSSPSIASLTVTSAFTATGLVTNAALATMPAFSFHGNNTSGVASPTNVTLPGLTVKASPVSGDLVMIADSAASNAWKQTTVGALASAGAVSSVNTLTGPVTIAGTGGISVTTSSPTVTVALSAGRQTLPTTIGPWTSGTDINQAIPANALWIEVFLWGPGGGGSGGGAGAGNGSNGTSSCWNVTGGTACGSSQYSAGGGLAGGASGGSGGAGGAVGGSLACNASGSGGIGQGVGGAGATVPGSTGGAASHMGIVGYGGAPNNNAAPAAMVNTGAGGGGGSTSITLIGNGGGGGAWCYFIINNPASNYLYTIGTGGAGGAGGTSGGAGGAGGSGIGYGIVHYNFLLKRDLSPPANDNTPAFLNAVA